MLPKRMVPARMPGRGDVVAASVLVALAVLAFGVPSLLGRPVLPGDDMTQNYPLRVLAGQEIRAGHLPLYNPYIWSGAPLLAGWNAAAAYPLTWLYAILPGITAWTVGLVVTYAVAALGMFCFLRALRLGSVASFAGAVSFALGGAMAAQVTHFGLVAGMSWVPLGLLAVLRLSEPSLPGRAKLRWVAVLGLAVGLIVLAGEPRAIADGLVIISLFAAWRAARQGRRWWPAALLVTSGVVLGAALSAIQVLPGLSAIDSSQRAGSSFALFSSGSLPPRWLLLLLVPDLLGGSGTASQPSYFATYNLTEVTGYAGILPLVAAFALLARVPWRGVGRRLLRRGQPAEAAERAQVPEWLGWHVIALVGLVLALGANTPLGPLLAQVPFFGTQRLQSRNILVLDLALAVLLAYWANHPFPARAPRRALERALAAVPAVAVIGIVAGASWMVTWLYGQAAPSEVAALRPWLVPFAVLAAAALALLAVGRRLPRRLCAALIAGFVVIDAIVFSVLAVVQVAPRQGSPVADAPPAAAATGPVLKATTTGALDAAVPHLSARPVSALGYAGRFAIYDPGLLETPSLSALDPPDLNSVNGTPSVQGYTSIVDGPYAAATGSHQATGAGQNVLSPAAVGDGTLDELDTTLLLTLPQYATTDLRNVLTPPHWDLAGFDGSFEIWQNTRAVAPLTLQALASPGGQPGPPAAGASVTALSGPATGPTSARVSSTGGVRVVRSVSAIPGWSATWQPLTGTGASGASGVAARPVSLPVRADGIVQAVDVPPGTGVLTWHYTTPHLAAGLGLSLAAVVVILGLWLGPQGLAALRRRRPDPLAPAAPLARA